MDTHALRTVPALSLMVLLALGTAACSGGGGSIQVSGTAAPAGLDTKATASATPGPDDVRDSGDPSDQDLPMDDGIGPGCPSGGPDMPAGANTAATTDLDGDDETDALWLKNDGARTQLGVRFAAGGSSAVTYPSVGTTTARDMASAAMVKGAVPVILVDTGDIGLVYTVHGCELVETKNVQGEQYSFAKGKPGTGTGAGCLDVDGTTNLVGYDAKKAADGSYRVSRTTITLQDRGRQARNGAKTVIGSALGGANPWVERAQQIRCGDRAPVVED